MEKGWVAKGIEYPTYLHAFTSLRPLPREDEVHVYPDDDLVMHALVGLECPCGVVRQDTGIYVHNSWDGREDAEEGTSIEVEVN